MNKNKYPAITVAVLLINLLIVAGVLLYALQPSKAQVDKCVETTNYSEERCIWEITR